MTKTKEPIIRNVNHRSNNSFLKKCFTFKYLGVNVSDLNIHSPSNASGIKTQFHSDKL